MSDPVNVEGSTFNAGEQLFNENNPAQTLGQRFLTQIPPTPTPPPLRPKRFTTFAPQTHVQVQAEPEPFQDEVSGCLAAMRAAVMTHLYRENAWERDFVPLMARNTDPNPTTEAEEQIYNDLLLFNYLPEALTPTKEDVQSLVRPQNREAVVRAQLDITTALSPPAEETGTAEVTLPSQVPFSESALSPCEI